MALICDICKTRPATARITFTHQGWQRILDVCPEDYALLETRNYAALPDSFRQEVRTHSEGKPPTSIHQLPEAIQEVLQRAAHIATTRGDMVLEAEHVFLSLNEAEAVKELWSFLKINTEDMNGYIDANLPKNNREVAAISASPTVQQLVATAQKISQELGHSELKSVDLIPAFLTIDSLPTTLLTRYGLTEATLRQAIIELDRRISAEGTSSKTPTLDMYSRNLSLLAKEGKLDPVIGRAGEIETAIEVLARRTKNNPVLIGEPGVGKTAIVEGLAQAIVEHKVPDILENKEIRQLDLNGLLAGARFRGEFEERLQNVLKEVTANSDSLIVFVDELHTIVGSGSAEGSLDAANILKPALARGDIHLVGATTLNEYQKYIEKDSALERRFQPITVPEPSIEDSIAIIHGLKANYETHHKVAISNEAITSAVELSDRYISQRFLPDKAIDLIDQAAARVQISRGKEKEATVTVADITGIISKLTGIPVTELTKEEREKLLSLEKRLSERVIGQHEAVRSVADAVRLARVGLTQPHKPTAAFLFLGPTGVGKTELAKALAATVFGNESSLTRIDMSEYMERHAVARLIGSPPGYVGYEEGGQLTEAVRRRPHSVILLDEIEKAHPDVYNVLLQLLDDGRLTDGKGRVVDFSNAIIIATSNLGSSDSDLGQRIGFIQDETGETSKQMRIMESVKAHFRPEFVNRLDQIIVFHSLSPAEIKEIVTLQIHKLQEKAKQQGIALQISSAAVTYLAEKGYSAEYGARELARVITSEVELPLARYILEDKAKKSTAVKVHYKKDQGIILS